MAQHQDHLQEALGTMGLACEELLTRTVAFAHLEKQAHELKTTLAEPEADPAYVALCIAEEAARRHCTRAKDECDEAERVFVGRLAAAVHADRVDSLQANIRATLFWRVANRIGPWATIIVWAMEMYSFVSGNTQKKAWFRLLFGPEEAEDSAYAQF